VLFDLLYVFFQRLLFLHSNLFNYFTFVTSAKEDM